MPLRLALIALATAALTACFGADTPEPEPPVILPPTNAALAASTVTLA
ncbi:hypothetical protein [Jannaschia marina]|nr:hypothetical protein [Jannaschia marina]